ncbi:hypothetical protein XBJ2_2350001 [Xenorhabdus bovienii str. Jollieti]|uniref:Uncharacterized protein n=1 Tax=Xenorhabdus bovienii (strain SS-2004) TaxID=406818 RepID=D3V2P9_XENBS|nr:hypothetical protein XBJ1_1888 [Xenorhabdus bovienii SS-2004]CDH29182.1 hypothetical protein XBJ2_2350001 [Xenorhabdus bovienii str. Jollieti]
MFASAQATTQECFFEADFLPIQPVAPFDVLAAVCRVASVLADSSKVHS